MYPTSILERSCLGENVYGSSSDKVEGHRDWNAPEYTNTAGTKEKKVTKALSFYKMETDEVSERKRGSEKRAHCCFEGRALLVKLSSIKEDPKEYYMEPRVILGRSFMRLVNGIIEFGSEVITVYPEQDPFENDSEKTEMSMDDWDQLLDFNFDDIPQLDGEEL
ncbi:hypothetical protein Tco_1309130 [Tanacetum coccineum]